MAVDRGTGATGERGPDPASSDLVERELLPEATKQEGSGGAAPDGSSSSSSASSSSSSAAPAAAPTPTSCASPEKGVAESGETPDASHEKEARAPEAPAEKADEKAPEDAEEVLDRVCERLRRLQRDTGRLHTLCDEAFLAQRMPTSDACSGIDKHANRDPLDAYPIRTPAVLQRAMNSVLAEAAGLEVSEPEDLSAENVAGAGESSGKAAAAGKETMPERDGSAAAALWDCATDDGDKTETAAEDAKASAGDAADGATGEAKTQDPEDTSSANANPAHTLASLGLEVDAEEANDMFIDDRLTSFEFYSCMKLYLDSLLSSFQDDLLTG